jgi:glycosyltransferase involved in cell wall biosynthesis
MSKPLYHIAHILPWSSVGGTEHAALRIAQAVKGEGFESTAFCLGGDSPVRELFAAGGFETVAYAGVEPSYRRPGGFLKSSLQLAREFKRRRVELIHCSDLLAAYYAAVAGKIAGLPVLCHVRCSYPNLSRRDRSFLRWVDRFVFVSHDTWRTFGYRVPEHRGTVVYDGIDTGTGGGDSGEQGVRREFEIPPNVKIIGMVSRVAPAKDFRTLARAAARVVGARTDVRFLIVGDHSQVKNYREHYAQVRRMLSEEGVGDYFIFTDHREDVARLIGAMDVFVLSTHTEGLPLVILEAMAQSVPIVATAVGGVPEIVMDGVTGLLHEHEDDAGLAAQIGSLLGDEARRLSLGEAGRQFVLTNFTREQFAASMVGLYSGMLGIERRVSERRPRPEFA